MGTKVQEVVGFRDLLKIRVGKIWEGCCYLGGGSGETLTIIFPVTLQPLTAQVLMWGPYLQGRGHRRSLLHSGHMAQPP